MAGDVSIGEVEGWVNLEGREYMLRTSLPSDRLCRVLDQRMADLVPSGYRHFRTTFGREHGKGGKYSFTLKVYWSNTKFPRVTVTDYAELMDDARGQVLQWWEEEQAEGDALTGGAVTWEATRG